MIVDGIRKATGFESHEKASQDDFRNQPPHSISFRCGAACAYLGHCLCDVPTEQKFMNDNPTQCGFSSTDQRHRKPSWIISVERMSLGCHHHTVCSATKLWPQYHLGVLFDPITKQTMWRIANPSSPTESSLITRLPVLRLHVIGMRGVVIRGLLIKPMHTSIFIGADSGPAQPARALWIRALVPHGPTDRRLFGDGRPNHALNLQSVPSTEQHKSR